MAVSLREKPRDRLVRSEEADIFKLGAGGRSVAVKWFRPKMEEIKFPDLERQRFLSGYYHYKIAELLFPNNVIHVESRNIAEGAVPGVQISKFENFDQLYLHVVRHIYRKVPIDWSTLVGNCKKCHAHGERFRSPEVSDLLKRMESAGLEPPPHYVNLGFRSDGTPVVIEFKHGSRINADKLQRYLVNAAVPTGVSAKVQAYLRRYEELYSGEQKRKVKP